MAEPTPADTRAATDVAMRLAAAGDLREQARDLIAQALADQRAALIGSGLVDTGPADIRTERIAITRDPKTGEPSYRGETPDGGTELSGFAGDIAHEVAYRLVEGSDVEQAEITVRWRGEY